MLDYMNCYLLRKILRSIGGVLIDRISLIVSVDSNFLPQMNLISREKYSKIGNSDFLGGFSNKSN